MKRRAFLRKLPTIPTGLAAGAVALGQAGCAGPSYLVPTAGAGTLSVRRADVEPGRPTLVELPGSGQPILLRRSPGSGWVALHARCTHRGCQPDPVGDRLVCPCHGSEFSLEGDVLEGPADRPLRRFPVREDGERIVIVLEGGS